ncbi:MAG: hemolysin family protein [Betaproteobacteria bacterium]|nr:hemolysin family protein [Betaproteobacteria bacterium]
MEIFVLVLLIVLNGIFSMSEIALVTARRTKLAKLAEEGDLAAKVAVSLGEEPTRFLSTIQIGSTSFGILIGVMSEAALSAPVAVWLRELGMAQRPAEIMATTFVVVLITFITIVAGELVPKRIGQLNPESIARRVARPMNALAIISRPIVRMLSRSTALLLRLLGLRDEKTPGVTEEEIHAMLEEGSESGVIEKNEHVMVRNVFRLDDRQIGSLMVPRSDIVWLDVERPLEENLARMAGSEYSRFPVCRGGLEEILGIISCKQLFNQTLKGGKPDITSQMQSPVFVPETLTGMELLEQFRASGSHMAFVIDEYGEVQGLVALQDVMEAVTGEFRTESQEDAWAVQREDGSWLLDGLIPLLELKDLLELREVPEEDKGRYHTLSGMIMWLLGRLPRTGDIIPWESWRLEVVDLDGKRIDKVLASRSPEPTKDKEGEAPAK